MDATADQPVPSKRAPRGPYRRLTVEARREQLIGIALDLFSRRAPEDVSLDDVAEAAGASRPLVYRYFPGGKQQLYEAALGTAATELARRFVEPTEGPATARLSHVLDRYFAFVDEHAAGYGALLRGGSVAETARTDAIVDEVRRAAYAELMTHLAVQRPGPRMQLLVRSWVSVVETAALSWLDEGRRIPLTELRDLLVDQFTAMLAVTAVHDPQARSALRGLTAIESWESRGTRLLGHLTTLFATPEPTTPRDHQRPQPD